MNYEYGEAYLDYPVEDFTFPDGSRIAVHDIFDPTPEFMMKADMVFVDPPWNQGNLRTFYTKAGKVLDDEYQAFYIRLFEVIREIDPKTCYVEVGKEYLPDFVIELRKIFRYVTFYNSTYYRKNPCYIIRASKIFRKPDFCKRLDGMDEQDIIELICREESYECIADPCMGQGLVGFYASTAGKRFVGTELNYKRLAVCRKRVEEEKL